jgi:hypothetical protein
MDGSKWSKVTLRILTDRWKHSKAIIKKSQLMTHKPTKLSNKGLKTSEPKRASSRDKLPNSRQTNKPKRISKLRKR